MNEEAPICYSLSRRQRLIPHLRVWGPFFVPFAVTLIAFFGVRSVYAIVNLEWTSLAIFGGLFVFFVFYLRGLVIGLLDVLIVRNRKMNITIENNGLGVMLGETRWYLFLDGVTRISEYVDGLLTLEHWNGSIVHIPKHLISTEQLTHIQERMAFGQTDDAVQKTIERGKIIEAITTQNEQFP